MVRHCAKGWEWSHSKSRCVPEGVEEKVEGEECVDKLERTAKMMVEMGAHPSFHFASPTVSPQATFVVPKELYDKYGVTEDYPFIVVGIQDVPIEEWAEQVGVDKPYLMYLAINSMTDMHNAVSSALDLSEYEFDNLKENHKLSSFDANIRAFKSDYAKGEIKHLGDSEHGDYYHSWERKTDDKKCEMGKELLEMWKVNPKKIEREYEFIQMRKKGQKTLDEIKRKRRK